MTLSSYGGILGWDDRAHFGMIRDCWMGHLQGVRWNASLAISWLSIGWWQGIYWRDGLMLMMLGFVMSVWRFAVALLVLDCFWEGSHHLLPCGVLTVLCIWRPTWFDLLPTILDVDHLVMYPFGAVGFRHASLWWQHHDTWRCFKYSWLACFQHCGCLHMGFELSRIFVWLSLLV